MTRQAPDISQKVQGSGQADKKQFSFKYLPPFIGLGLLIAAIVVIWHQFRHLSLHNILSSVAALPPSALWKGVGATVLSYGILAFYDGLACRHVKAGLSWRKIAFVSFCAYVLAHNLGFSAISGTAVRYRLYRNWGVPGRKIASIVAFCSLTYFLGMTGLIGVILLWQPGTIPLLSHYGAWLPLLLGGGCFLLLCLYVFAAYKKQSLSFRGHKIDVPNGKIAIGQIITSMADMSATALIAWCLIGSLPAASSLTFGSFLGIYLFSYTAGLLTNIPGGLGVFDGAMVVALSPWLPVSHIMATVLMFRVMYYLVPLMLAGIAFAAHELCLKAHFFHNKGFVLGRREQKLRQSESYFAAKVAGSAQLFVALIIAGYAIITSMPQFSSLQFPSGHYAAFIDFITLLLVLTAIALMAASFALLNRVALAWRLSVGLLCFAEVLLVLRHAHWVFYCVILCSLLIVLPFRHSYYRKASIISEPLSPLLLVFLGVFAFGFCGVWWMISRQGLGMIWRVPEAYNLYNFRDHCFMLALALGCFFTFLWSLRRTCLHPLYWTPIFAAAYACLDTQNRFRHFIKNYALRPDGFFYDESRQAALAFIRKGNIILALGEPVGNPVKTQAAIWRLRDYADQENCSLAFLQRSERYKKLYEALGLSRFELASEGIMFCSGEVCQRLKAELKSVILSSVPD